MFYILKPLYSIWNYFPDQTILLKCFLLIGCEERHARDINHLIQYKKKHTSTVIETATSRWQKCWNNWNGYHRYNNNRTDQYAINAIYCCVSQSWQIPIQRFNWNTNFRQYHLAVFIDSCRLFSLKSIAEHLPYRKRLSCFVLTLFLCDKYVVLMNLSQNNSLIKARSVYFLSIILRLHICAPVMQCSWWPRYDTHLLHQVLYSFCYDKGEYTLHINF